MKPVAVIPMNDPGGIMFPHLKRITPQLKTFFSQVFVSVPLMTQRRFPEHVVWLQSDAFFQATYHDVDMPVGEDFLTLYKHAAAACESAQVLHLCFIDRVAFALQSEHCGAFTADIQTLDPHDTPLIFQRSEQAWQTHPRNYREIEGMVTKAGEFLFGKSLDFAWCHLVIRADRLLDIIPLIKNRDISFMAELVLAVRDEVRTRDVDWLSWEDPFILSKEPQALKEEREESIGETHKRLGYVIPMLQLLVAASKDD